MSLAVFRMNRWFRIAMILAVIVLAGAILGRNMPAQDSGNASQPATQSSPVFTTAHRTVGDAVR